MIIERKRRLSKLLVEVKLLVSQKGAWQQGRLSVNGDSLTDHSSLLGLSRLFLECFCHLGPLIREKRSTFSEESP